MKKIMQNPYLPLWEHLPDGEPRVFDDPDNPGRQRIYIIGSHDLRMDSYCGPDIRIWSAPVEDLSDWRDHGAVFTYQSPTTGKWDVMYAPDLVEVNRRNGKREYYLFPHSRGPGREAMVAKGDRPDGPFTPINVDAERRLFEGSILGFDPSVYIEQINDPADPDYEIGFRAYAFWGFQKAHAGQLDQNTMYTLRPGTEVTHFYIPSSSSYGNLRDPQGTAYPAIFPDEDLTQFNYFEAFSIRKVGNKFVLAFSGYSGPDYGLPSTNSTLRYMFGDTPLGPWRAGGVLVDSRGPVPNEDGSALRWGSANHNTHGGLECINGQWYAFYHRPPRSFGYARQAVVAPVTIAWDEKSVANGGRVTIRGYDPFAADGIWTVMSGTHEYTGAQITSEGFAIFGLDPFQYYSAGIASFLSTPQTLKDAWDIWNNHQPIESVNNDHIIGFQHFGFGGLAKTERGVPAFEGTKAGDNTHLNVFITPRTNAAFKINVWLDGAWQGAPWHGKPIGSIEIPANAPRNITRYSVDVAQHVEGLSQKNAVFFVAEGGEGELFDFIGLGFSSDAHKIDMPDVPVVEIKVNGTPQTLPPHPVRSTEENGYVGCDIYEMTVDGVMHLPSITATARANSPAKINITINEGETPNVALVAFDYNGVVKTYRLIFTQA
ncbi:MAG: hypothetical protein FWC71_03710 [Defluviitaleaceae bacterium]|nr:hypothetical protein [Defluviitaleaceae bacterium]